MNHLRELLYFIFTICDLPHKVLKGFFSSFIFEFLINSWRVFSSLAFILLECINHAHICDGAHSSYIWRMYFFMNFCALWFAVYGTVLCLKVCSKTISIILI